MKNEVIHIEEKSFELSDAVKMAGGIDTSWCYQCGKCATGCPVAFEMDLTPTHLTCGVYYMLFNIIYKR